jgi:hypothetical protein
MSRSQNDRGTTPTPPPQSTVVLLLGTIADTTWRMFIPIIGLTLLGVFGDNTYHTKPWLTVVGIVAGVTVASLLVIRQLKKVNR